MRHGKRDGTDAPKPAPERTGTQTRAKQTASANENGTSSRGAEEGLREPCLDTADLDWAN
jgi:hypothetical protein